MQRRAHQIINIAGGILRAIELVNGIDYVDHFIHWASLYRVFHEFDGVAVPTAVANEILVLYACTKLEEQTEFV